MPQLLKRAINRQKAIRESRDLAWMLFVVALGIAYVGVAGVLRSIEIAGTVLTSGGIVSGLVGLVAARVALHLLLEGFRLGRLMKDSDQIMRLDDSSSLASGVRWSALIPFGRWRGQGG
jgi:hypothetical protein